MKVSTYRLLPIWVLSLTLLSYIGAYGEEMDVAQAQKAIEKGGAQFVEALNRGDAAAIAAMYTDDAILLPPNSEMIRGRQGVQEFWNTALQMGVKSVTVTTVDTHVSGDTAYRVVKYTLTIQPQGQGSMIDSGKAVDLWKRQADGSWKVQVDIWNSSLPAQPGSQPEATTGGQQPSPQEQKRY